MVYIFFGAGRIGLSVARLWRECGCSPKYFIDNNKNLWGQTCEGIQIDSPERLRFEKESFQVVLTCKNGDELFKQLLEYGIAADRINRDWWRLLPDVWDRKKKYRRIQGETQQNGISQRVLFDLQNGLVLGGVESWTFQTSRLLRSKNIDVKYLITDLAEHSILDEKKYSIELKFSRNVEMREHIHMTAEAICRNAPCTVICNFPGFILWGACFAKHMNPEKIRLMTVVHNDEAEYYETYVCMERYIDACFAISKRIEQGLLEKGFPENKIQYLPWEIPCMEPFARTYTSGGQELKLGYAGRVTVRQKRMDLLLEVARKLYVKDIQFVLEIAGTGDYLDTFRTLAEKEGLAEKVRFRGFIERDCIMDFWRTEDVMISCSDFEGHSISQCEAMAAGAVPVVTDTSGARDDIIDGENGFVADVGAVDQIVEKICFLYFHRELLPIMGEKAYRTIRECNSRSEIELLWNRIFET